MAINTQTLKAAILAQKNKRRALFPEVFQSESMRTGIAGFAEARGKTAMPVQANEAPTSNTGRLETAAVSRTDTVFVMLGGKMKELPVKVGVGTAAHIDAFTFSLPADIFIRDDSNGDDEIAGNVSASIEEIMGYGLFRQANGRNGYRTSYLMGNDKVSYGYVAFGGPQQRGSLCIHFTGTGLLAAHDNWERRLYDFLQDYCPNARITRCDLAHDFFNGEYTPDQALTDWESGLFTACRTCPIAECVGSDWLTSTSKGKTFYVGSRKSSKYCRIYEKGKQLGDETSDWVRFELELKNKDIVIPHDILLNPGQYLTGAYPVCEQLFHHHQEQIAKPELKKKLEQVSQEHVIKYARIQAAPGIKMMRHYGFSTDEIIAALENELCNYPKRLNPAAFDVSNLTASFIHQFKRIPRHNEELIPHNDRPARKHPSYAEYRQKQRDIDPHWLMHEASKHLTPAFLLNPKYDTLKENP